MKRSVIIRTAIVAAAAIAVVGIYKVRLSMKDAERASDCYAQLGEVLQSGVDPTRIYQQRFADLQLLVEKSLVARTEMLVVSNRLRVDKDAPLSSRDLVTLKSGTEAYLGLRENLYDIANAYECAVDADDKLLQDFNISPELRLKALMLSLGAALTLYDNYLLGVVHFEHDERLRRILNDPDMGFGLVANKLAEATLAANSIEVRHRARRAIEFYENEKKLFTDAHEDSDEAYLMQLIESSPSYNYVRKIRVGEIAGNKVEIFGRIAVDGTSAGAATGMDLLSGLFGNTVGLYESRKGKLYGDEAALRHIEAQLQPLDILLEKTPFRLTDKLIPGHFGHVAIWTGSQAELVDAGVWDELIVNQYADDIDSEHRIIEALRSGVQLSRLEEFLNVDDLVVLRPVFDDATNQADTREALLMAFRQVGKKYDFNFDVNTTDKIVCSELAYISFPAIDWPTDEVLGRHSISPDNVAQMAWQNVPLSVVMFYHDGELVPEEEQADKMRELMLD
jgi:hypothetical protein